MGTFCSNLPSALELIKSKKKKDQRFSLFMQVRSAGNQSRAQKRAGPAKFLALTSDLCIPPFFLRQLRGTVCVAACS